MNIAGTQKQIRASVAAHNRQQAVSNVNQYFSLAGFSEIRARTLMVCSPPAAYTDFYNPNKEAGVVKEADGSFVKCVRWLEGYASNLLKPVGSRAQWKHIQYAQGDYPSLISMYMGSEVVLKLLGYRQETEGFVYPSHDTQNKEKVVDVATDLLILDVALTYLVEKASGVYTNREPERAQPLPEQQVSIPTKLMSDAEVVEFCAICGNPRKCKHCDKPDCKEQAMT